MLNKQWRAYLVSGELGPFENTLTTGAPREEYLLLWLVNGPFGSGSYNLRMEFGSYEDEGGVVHFAVSARYRWDLGNDLWTRSAREFDTQGSLATATSLRSDDDFTTQTITFSYFTVGESTGVEIGLASDRDDAGALVELTDPQRKDLSYFMKASRPKMVDYDTTELVFPTGNTKMVKTTNLHNHPETHVEWPPS